jgi:hypothetical protein
VNAPTLGIYQAREEVAKSVHFQQIVAEITALEKQIDPDTPGLPASVYCPD